MFADEPDEPVHALDLLERLLNRGRLAAGRSRRDGRIELAALDGGRGEVSRNRFVNCGDEGIDASQNDALQVHDNVVLDRRGGRIGAERNLEAILTHNRRGYPDRN